MATKLLRLQRLGLLSAGGAPVIAATVHAAGQEEATEGNKVKISELPIYGAPVVKTKFVPEEITPLQQNISVARKAVWKWMDSMEATRKRVVEIYETGRAHTKSSLDYLQNDPGMVRYAVICIAGLGGIMAAYKKRTFTKVVYFSIAVGASASICYPNEAVAITQEGYKQVKDLIPEDVFKRGGKSD